MVPREVIEQIKYQIPIRDVVSEYVRLQKKGANYSGICPFHKEKTASFMVHDSRQIFHCFGCGESGNVFTFLMKMEGISFPESVERLAKKAGIDLKPEGREQATKRKIYYEVYDMASGFYRDNLTNDVIGYLKRRGFKESTIEQWGIGYAPEGWESLIRHIGSAEILHEYGLAVKKEGSSGFYDRFRGRVMIPIKDRSGKIIAFAGRLFPEIEGQPKFLNSPETRFYHKNRTLFGLDEKTARAIREKGCAIGLEGYFDKIILHQEGFENTVALGSTSLSREQAETLSKIVNRIILCLDNDEGGVKGTIRAGKLCLKGGLETMAVILPEGNDPDDMAIKRKGELERILSTPKYLIDFAMEHLVKTTHPDEVFRDVRKLYDIVDSANSPLLSALYLKSISERFCLKPQTIWTDYGDYLNKKRGRTAKKTVDPEIAVLSYLAHNSVCRRRAGHILSPEDFSSDERKILFDFLTSSRDIININIKPEEKIEKLPPLLKTPSVSRLIKKIIAHCGEMEVCANEENIARLIAEISSVNNDDASCIDKFRAMKIRAEIDGVKSKIESIESREGSIESVMELNAKLYSLEKEMKGVGG